jgi:DNA-binding CsgD family transcriptional regulator
VPDHDFFQTPYYRDWVRPQGLVDCMYVVLDRSGPQLTLFAVSRHKDDGAVDDRMFRRMRMIAPHLGRAIRIGQTIGLERRAAANLADALDGLSSAMFLVDAVGHVVHANAAGHSLLSKDDVLSVAGGRLRARDAESSSLLKDAFSAAGAGDAVAHTGGSSLPLVARDGDDYVARVLPLSARARRQAGKESGAVAAVFVCRAAPPEPAPSELIARRYRLTPMELRVLTAIVDIRGVANVADALGISSETVKTHLAHVYEKTGVNRQADLVKLVLRLSIPRIG